MNINELGSWASIIGLIIALYLGWDSLGFWGGISIVGLIIAILLKDTLRKVTSTILSKLKLPDRIVGAIVGGAIGLFVVMLAGAFTIAFNMAIGTIGEFPGVCIMIPIVVLPTMIYGAFFFKP